jgi:hypothetical protein
MTDSIFQHLIYPSTQRERTYAGDNDDGATESIKHSEVPCCAERTIRHAIPSFMIVVVALLLLLATECAAALLH